MFWWWWLCENGGADIDDGNNDKVPAGIFCLSKNYYGGNEYSGDGGDGGDGDGGDGGDGGAYIDDGNNVKSRPLSASTTVSRLFKAPTYLLGVGLFKIFCKSLHACIYLARFPASLAFGSEQSCQEKFAAYRGCVTQPTSKSKLFGETRSPN